MTQRVSMVIRALNEEQHIGRLLTGVAMQTVQPNEIVVVDSGSTDATVAIAERFPNVHTVAIDPATFSFGRSLNVGCRASTGDVIVIVSAHVYPLYNTWLAELLAPFQDSSVALSYGRQVGDERTQFSEWQVLRKWFPEASRQHQSHPFCNNANAAIRRSVWKAQPYNEDLTGLEDLDWAKRALGAGYEVSYVAEAVVAHVHREAWRQTMNRYRREAIAHRQIFPEQRLNMVEAVGLAVANILGDIGRATKDRALRGNLANIVRFRTAQFVGGYAGFSLRAPEHEALKRRFYYPSKPRFWREPAPPRGAVPIDYTAASDTDRERM